MINSILRFGALALLTSFCLSAKSSNIFYVPYSVDAGAISSDFSSFSNGGIVYGPNQVAQPFYVEDGFYMDGLSWWGQYALYGVGLEGSDDFTVRVFSGVGDRPSSTPIYEKHLGAVSKAATGDISYDEEVFSYTASLSGRRLFQGGKYWISIVNNTADDVDDNWFWQRFSLDSGDVVVRGSDILGWNKFGYGSTLSIEIRGSMVPEPGTYLLMLAGLAAVTGVVRARRHKRRDGQVTP